MAGGYLCKRLGKEGQPYRGLRQGGKPYKAKVASLTSKRASLRAQIRDLTEELVKHRSDMKHASMARAQTEDKENEARKDVKVAEDELWLAREEVQAVKGDLWAKITTLERARQEALEAGNSVERLTEELGRLRMDLKRQEALVSRRGEVIAELRNKYPMGLRVVAFQRGFPSFPRLRFYIQLSDEEVEGSASEAEVNAGAEVLSRPLIVLPCLMIFGFLQRSAPLLRLLGLRLLASKLCTLTLPYSGAVPEIFVLLLTLTSSLIYKGCLINFIALFIVLPI